MDKEANREQLKKEFAEYLSNCASSQQTKEPLKPASIKNIIKNLNPDFVFDVVPSLRNGIESFYDYQDPNAMIDVLMKLKNDWRFKDNDNHTLRMTALSHYINFLRSLAHFSSKNANKLADAKTQFPSLHKQAYEPLMPLQQIFFGAPGTGKSFRTNEVAKKYSTIRTTFHPDSDYSTFVGAYKPTTRAERIEYRFVKQAFLKAYINAWKLFCSTDDNEIAAPQFLVIEEINRGNCAQIFGDLFQLLDRKNGFSEYPIDADEDIRKCLMSEDTEEDPSFGTGGLQFTDVQKSIINAVFNEDSDDMPFRDVADDIARGKSLVLPSNLYIWATMNTSDQSLFPIDSAFKRRWDWQYVPIANGNKDWKIIIGNSKFDWWRFIEKINSQIGVTTNSEDKKLGYYFCKADNEGKIDDKTFVGKVLFYLWNDVFKDYDLEGQLFEDSDGEKMTFDKFYKVEAGKTIVEREKVISFLQKLDQIINPAIRMEEIWGDKEQENDILNQLSKSNVAFSLDGGKPMSMTLVAKQVVSNYSNLHPEESGEQIRDLFNNVCDHIVVETQADYNARKEASEKSHGGQELILPNGEKIYTSNQWEWKSAESSFARFIKAVRENGWGVIVEVTSKNE